MKAYQLYAVNDLRYGDIEEPILEDGWVLVQVKAVGICSSDIPRIFENGTYHFPTIPGHEFSGVVKKVFSKDDEEWIGKSVGVFPLIPCKICEQCKKQNYEMCENYDYIGSRRDGAFADYVAVPVWNLLELPSEITFEEAAMLEPVAVALHAIKKAKINDSTESVAIIGTGMIGCAAAQWAKFFGAKHVCVIGRNENKRKMVESLGNIEYLTETQELFDVVIEAVGSNSAVEQAINIAQPGRSVVLMGNPEADIILNKKTYWRILRKQLNVIGTWNSFYEAKKQSDWSEACKEISLGNIKVLPLITHLYKYEELPAALELMKQHTEPYCKVMTLWNQE